MFIQFAPPRLYQFQESNSTIYRVDVTTNASSLDSEINDEIVITVVARTNMSCTRKLTESNSIAIRMYNILILL